MLKYFKDCNSKEECKKLYKKLAFMYHPDRGGDTETMKAINEAQSGKKSPSNKKHK